MQARMSQEFPTGSAVPLEGVPQQLADLRRQLAAQEAELKRRELKIQPLTLALALHQRLRFSAKSEAFSAEQRDLFIDTHEEDGAALTAEWERVHPPAATPCLRSCPASSTGMSRPPAPVADAAAPWS